MLPFWIKYFIYPFLGALIGFLTNWIAITLLFRPRKKIFGIQGILEKRKSELAKITAEVISEYLFNTKEIKKFVNKQKVRTSIEKLVDKTLSKIPKFGRRILSKSLRDITYLYFFDKDGLIKEEILELALSDTELEKIIIDKIMSFEISEIEHIIKKASGPEINFILVSGAVLGFVVGIIEIFLPF